MTSERLVAALVADLKPVRRISAHGTRALIWAAFALIWVSLATSVLGIRADLLHVLHDPSYVTESAALCVVFALAARAAFRLSVPGVASERWLPLAALLVWVAAVVLRSDAALSSTLLASGSACVWRMSALALIPGLAVLRMLRRAAPLEPGWTGLSALLSTSALAMLGTQALCAKDDAGHVLAWHVVPVLLATLLGAGLGKRFLRR
jgi:hypothetical protein